MYFCEMGPWFGCDVLEHGLRARLLEVGPVELSIAANCAGKAAADHVIEFEARDRH